MGRQIIKYGEVDGATGTEELVWAKKGAYAFPTTEQKMLISSSSADDALAGTGARTLNVRYLDDDFVEKAEVFSMGNFATNLVVKGDMTGTAGTDFKDLGLHGSLAIAGGVGTFTPIQQYDGIKQDADGSDFDIVGGDSYLVRMKAKVASGAKDLGARLYSNAGVHQVETATVVGTIQSGVEQVETATAAGTITTAGLGEVTVTSALFASDVVLGFSVELSDGAAEIASSIRSALGIDPVITEHFTVSGTGADIILTALLPAANDATLNIAIANDTCEGITEDATSADTLAGVASGAGNASVIVTSTALGTASPKTVLVAVAEADDASAIAGKIRVALAADTAINAVFAVSGATDKVILTRRARVANDATLNIAIDNMTSIGITPALTSANTVAGVAEVPISDIVEFDFPPATDFVEIGAILTATDDAESAIIGIFDMSTSGFVEITVDNVMLIDLNDVSQEEETVDNLIDMYPTYFAGTATYTATLASDIYRIVGVEVASAGSGLKNAGNISVTNMAGSATYAYIATGRNIAEQLVMTVPINKWFDIRKFSAFSNLAAGGKLSSIELKSNYNPSTRKLLSAGSYVSLLKVMLKDENIVVDNLGIELPKGSDIIVVTSGDATAKVGATLVIHELGGNK